MNTPSSCNSKDLGTTAKRPSFLKLSNAISFHAEYFRISLALSAQSLLWKTLTNNTQTHHHTLPYYAFIFIWFLSFFSITILSSFYIARCIFRFSAVKLEFSHYITVNYLYAPFISSLLLLESSPYLNSISSLYPFFCFPFIVPLLIFDIKIYGQWFTTKGKRFLYTVANPTSQLSVIGNLVGARALARMGWQESAMFMFALGMAHYFVLFVTLYQRLEFGGGGSVPSIQRPVFFLFFATPSMASLAWSSIIGSFDAFSKMLFFLAIFLFASLVSRPALFKKSMRKFNTAWWAYSFPLTLLALAADEYTHKVKCGVSNVLMLALSVISVLITLVLLLFSAIKPTLLLPYDDPFLPN